MQRREEVVERKAERKLAVVSVPPPTPTPCGKKRAAPPEDEEEETGSSSPPPTPRRPCVGLPGTTAPQAFAPALVAGKYLLLEQLDGSSSSLYRCLNVHTHQELVCKVVERDCSALLSAHYRLEAEPRVQRLEEVLLGQRQHLAYLVYERPHGDLHSYVRARRRLREPEARRLFRQIAQAVRSCHLHGLVLRDLKLRKFVFSDPHRTELKLESLEDAVVLGEDGVDLLQDKRGCPAYVSPEILRANTSYSGRAADMWSLGVILYTMLVGRYPFNDSSHGSLFVKISRGQYSLPEWLGPRARCLLRALLRREPHERLDADDVLHHPWLRDEDGDREVEGVGDQAGPEAVPPGSSRHRPAAPCPAASPAGDQVVPVWQPPPPPH